MSKPTCHPDIPYTVSRNIEAKRAFTLVELIVAVAVLIVMLLLAGQVFSVTVRTSGQARAVTRNAQALRAFEQALREDLRAINPDQSVMVIMANPVNAFWTREQAEAFAGTSPITGYPHNPDPEREDANGNLIAPRADMLMIFTARSATSNIYDADQSVSSELQQLVYGHAELGEYDANGLFDLIPGQFPFDVATNYPSTSLVSSVPAFNWHLARRSVLLVSSPNVGSLTPPWATSLTADAILNGSMDVVGNFDFEQSVLRPGGLLEGPPHYLPLILQHIDDFTITQEIEGDISRPHPLKRSRLDETMPPVLGARIGNYFLPRCASFKVEWAVNPKSPAVNGRMDDKKQLFWIDPGSPDSLKNLQAAITGNGDPLKEFLDDPIIGPTGSKYSFRERFGSADEGGSPDWKLAPDGRNNLVVFTATRGVPSSNQLVAEEIFPVALRITIDLFDEQGRLDRPTRYVIVAKIGE